MESDDSGFGYSISFVNFFLSFGVMEVVDFFWYNNIVNLLVGNEIVNSGFYCYGVGVNLKSSELIKFKKWFSNGKSFVEKKKGKIVLLVGVEVVVLN